MTAAYTASANSKCRGSRRNAVASIAEARYHDRARDPTAAFLPIARLVVPQLGARRRITVAAPPAERYRAIAVSTPQFLVPVADLERGPKRISWQLSKAWLQRALEGSGADPRTDGSLDLELTKNGPEVLVRGTARASLAMSCVRTLEPVDIELQAEIFLLLLQLPDAESPNRKQRQRHQPKGRKGATKKPEHSPKAGNWGEDPVLSEEDAARDSFRGERLELDEFIREFILLELPMAPMRSDLHLEPDAASCPPSAEQDAPSQLDPRLAPLAAIASRMRQKENKE